MGRKEGKASGQSNPRYVWDPNKLSWVEAAEPVQEAPSRVEEAEAEPVEEAEQESALEGVQEEAAEEEAGAELGVMVYKVHWSRLGAFIIDFLLLAVVEKLLSYVTGESYFTWYAIAAVYFIGMWAWRGQTIGKFIIGAKIVKTDGSPIGLSNAFLRYIPFASYFAIFSFGPKYVSPIVVYFILFIVFLVVVYSSKRRGLHDFIAGTVVIESRTPKPQPLEAEPADTSGIAEPSVASEPETDKQE